ncbi:hypothetical protein RchiOBHm_Chr4g0389681 [Rosa chinensis]|uniref:Uncharacterized protein n=1 Tax=Rosa chinensis TaxID=74649 RepID=A0A2P6QQ30_ROSCH|nr:hypothetical protein RchiOBHm_Chr4g0389681 [Rosa chinensis]
MTAFLHMVIVHISFFVGCIRICFFRLAFSLGWFNPFSVELGFMGPSIIMVLGLWYQLYGISVFFCGQGTGEELLHMVCGFGSWC